MRKVGLAREQGISSVTMFRKFVLAVAVGALTLGMGAAAQAKNCTPISGREGPPPGCHLPPEQLPHNVTVTFKNDALVVAKGSVPGADTGNITIGFSKSLTYDSNKGGTVYLSEWSTTANDWRHGPGCAVTIRTTNFTVTIHGAENATHCDVS